MTIGGNAVALKQTQNGTETHERGSGNVADDVFDLDNTIGYGSCDGNGGDYDDDLMFQLLSQFESKFPVSASGGPSSAPNSCAPAAPSLTQPSVISVATAAAMTSTITGTNLHRPALIQHQYSLPGSPHCQTKRAPPLQQQALIHQSHNNSVTGDDLVRLRRQIASVQQEKRALMMEKLSKEGEVTIVRNRLIQIEDENKQLRNQINQVSTQQQQQIRNVESKFQRELELMRTQLLFQSQELLEAKQQRVIKSAASRTATDTTSIITESAAAKSLRHGNGFDTAIMPDAAIKVEEQQNEQSHQPNRPDVNYYSKLLCILQHIEDPELKAKLVGSSLNISDKTSANEALAPILDSALQQAVSNANLKAIHDLIRFIVEGYFGNDKDSSCRQNLQISIANCVKSALRDARWSVLVELLESLLMSVENNNRLDFIDLLIDDRMVSSLVTQASAAEESALLAIKVLSYLASRLPFGGVFTKLPEALHDNLYGCVKWNSDESPSSHQRWLLYFFACFVFYHRSEQSLVFLLTKLLPRLVLLLLNTFDSAYYDLFNGEFYRIESIRLLVRLIYLLNKAASQFNGCDALFATGSIEVLPDVSIRILPVLYNVLERLPEIKIIFPDLSFDDELLLADLLLRNRH